MSFNLSPPPKPQDKRFEQWLFALWQYLRDPSNNNGQIIEMTQIFGKKETPYPSANSASQAQDILATQIFGA